MKNNSKIKKIINFLFASTLLFGLIMPLGVAFAEDPTPTNSLIIEAGNITLKPGESTSITAKTYALESKKISFTIYPVYGAKLSSSTCIAKEGSSRIYSCTVNFTVEKTETNQIYQNYQIEASINTGRTKSNVLEIKVPPPIELNPSLSATAKTPLYPGDSTDILVKTSDKKQGVKITFPFFLETCTTFLDGSCSIPFSSTTEGPEKIDFTAIGYIDGNITITIDKTAPRNTTTLKDSSVKETDTNYQPLAGLPGLEKGKNFDTSQECAFGQYLNIIFKLIIGICAVLAMVMIVYGGIEYITGGAVSEKENGKATITNAILGIIIALGSYLLLNTLNPQLLNVCLKLPEAKITIQPLYDRGYNDPKQANGESINCTPLTSGPCSVANLTTALGVDTETATAMSKICNMESGGQPIVSGTDYCSPPGKSLPFSFGLFQINLASNGNLAGPDCVGLFDRAVSSKDAIAPKYTSGFACSLLSDKQSLYNTCKNRLLDTATNLSIVKKLLTANPSKGDWIGDKKYCASAFK